MEIFMAGTSTEDANDLGYTSSRKGTRHDQRLTNFGFEGSKIHTIHLFCIKVVASLNPRSPTIPIRPLAHILIP